MKDVVKQRLVGALILLALGVIFWPIIFVDPDAEIDMQDLQVPPRPEIDRRPPEMGADPFSDDGAIADRYEQLPEPEPAPEPEAEQEAEQDAEAETGTERAPAPIPAPGETREAPMAAPQLDSQGLPVVWTLQLVTLSDGIKAEALRQQLLQEGYKAYVKAVTVEGKPLYRVHIGPKGERAQLKALQAELDERLGVNSMIRRYLP